MNLAFLYAGQGSQHPGMGRDLYGAYPAFRAAFDAGNPGFDLRTTCFEDPQGVLNETRYTQPCMVAFAAGITAVLYENGIRPQYAAGLSLGEYSALHAAGVWDAKTAVELAAFRGRAMEQAAEGLRCGMTAVLGLARPALQSCCDRAAPLGVVEICNENCPGQLVIGGEKDTVDAAAAFAAEQGAKRCLPLKVSGPFHTSLMRRAGNALAAYFPTIAFAPMQFPVLFNCLGNERGEGDTIPVLLERQVQSGVQMEKTIRRLQTLGVDTVLEIGPGRALSGFVKKTAGDAIRCRSVETAEELQALLTDWKGA